MTNVYQINSLLISADTAPKAAELAKLMGETGYPKLVKEPTGDQRFDAAMNTLAANSKRIALVAENLD